MTEFFKPTDGFSTPRFVTISAEAQALTQEAMRLFNCVLIDPSAGVHVRSKFMVEKRVPHARQQGVTLQVIRSKFSSVDVIPDESAPPGSTVCYSGLYSELGIFDQDGGMVLLLEHRKLPVVDLRKDPFAEHILESFRSHLDAASPAPPNS